MSMFDKGKYADFEYAKLHSKLVAPVDADVEREKHGYDVSEEKIIKCADCNKKLVEIITVQESDEIKMVIAECPCGGSSFLYEVKGRTFIQPVEGRELGEMPVEIKDKVMHITIKVL